MVEVVRHLLYSEELFLNRRILGNNEPWCPLGLLPDFLTGDPDYAGVGSEPSTDIIKILNAWEGLHAHMRAFVAGLTVDQLHRPLRDLSYGSGDVAAVMKGMPQHDLVHIRQAEKALAAG